MENRVKVKDDATMWGEPNAPTSSYAGQEGVIIGPADNYDVWVELDNGRRAMFFKRELIYL